MAVIKTVVHSTKKFTYSPETRTFAAEVSDFQDVTMLGSMLDGRIYDDAADLGFWLQSHRTGEEKPFAFWDMHFDGEDELTHWEYREIDPKTGRHVEGGMKVVVFND